MKKTVLFVVLIMCSTSFYASQSLGATPLTSAESLIDLGSSMRGIHSNRAKNGLADSILLSRDQQLDFESMEKNDYNYKEYVQVNLRGVMSRQNSREMDAKVPFQVNTMNNQDCSSRKKGISRFFDCFSGDKKVYVGTDN